MLFNRSTVFWSVVVGLLALVVRLPGLGAVTTVDEVTWMDRSAFFYDELLAGNPDGAFVSTHPGATLMWLAGGGIVLQEQRIGFQMSDATLLHFRKAAIFPLVIVTALLLMLITWLLSQLFTRPVAVVSGFLLAVDPYLLGMTQITHLDGLLGLLMMSSLLAWLVFLRKRQLRYVTVASIFFGLALGTKLFAAVILGPVVLTLLLLAFRPVREHWHELVRILMFSLGITVLTFFIVWPALWVKDDIDRSFIRDASYVLLDEHVQLESSDSPIAPATFYARTLLGRTPPHVLILLSGAVFIVGVRLWKKRWDEASLTISTLCLYGLLYLLVITLVAKKADRYLMPTLVVLPLIAGWAGHLAWRYLQRFISRGVQSGLLATLGVSLVLMPLLLVPHTIAYNSPLFMDVRPLSQQGWGEGLEVAATWLNEQSDAEDLRVASWYPRVLGVYLEGQAISLERRADERTDFVVLYRNMLGREPDSLASQAWADFVDQEPVFVYEIQGVPYVWVYEVSSSNE